MESKEYQFNKRKAKISYTSLDYSKGVYAFLINDGDLIREINYRDNVIYVSLSTENRLDDYTPWPNKALNPRFPDFGGKGKDYLDFLNNEFLPHLLSDFPINKDNIIYGGISLGGLHAAYSSYLPNPFKMYFGIVSSFWYPGFLDFMNKNDLNKKESSFFLLNGEKEGSKHKGIPLEFAFIKAKEASEILKSKSAYVDFVYDNYSHHEKMSERFEIIQQRIFKFIGER